MLSVRAEEGRTTDEPSTIAESDPRVIAECEHAFVAEPDAPAGVTYVRLSVAKADRLAVVRPAVHGPAAIVIVPGAGHLAAEAGHQLAMADHRQGGSLVAGADV